MFTIMKKSVHLNIDDVMVVSGFVAMVSWVVEVSGFELVAERLPSQQWLLFLMTANTEVPKQSVSAFVSLSKYCMIISVVIKLYFKTIFHYLLNSYICMYMNLKLFYGNF
jgi:hypothetical protein